MKNVLVHPHMGLGDHIDLNGAIRCIANQTQVYLLCKNRYKDAVVKMYRDNPSIKVLGIDAENLTEEYKEVSKQLQLLVERVGRLPMLTIGHNNYPSNPDPNRNCWEYFYEQLHFPLACKYECYFYERDAKEEQRVYDKLNPSNEPYIFVHDDPRRGFEINSSYTTGKKIIRNDMTENIMDFGLVIENATEIHCMESSFKSLVEHTPTRGTLYYHDFRGHPLGYVNKDWKVIPYAANIPTTDY